jgi:RNA polymerase sigma-70 factor (ECF subfamily)
MPPLQAPAPGLDPESAAWLRALAADGPDREDGLARLHALLLRIGRAEVHRRSGRVAIYGAELDDLAHQAAADALLAITGKLEQFRGESRFTTWAYRFVVFEVSSTIGRHFRHRPVAELEPEEWDRLPDRLGLDPAQESESRELVAAVRRAVEQELTERQRRVFTALVLDGVPLDALAVQLDSSRGAIYKTMFDARRKVRSVLVARGYLDPAEARHA